MARRGPARFAYIYIYIYDYMYIWTRALALADVCDKPIYYMLAYVLWAIRIHAIGWQQSVNSRMCCVFAFHMRFKCVKCVHSALESVCDVNLSATRLRMEKIRTLHVVLVCEFGTNGSLHWIPTHSHVRMHPIANTYLLSNA